MTVATVRRAPRVLHVLKQYSPDRKGSGVPAEVPAAVVPAGHDLLVTEAPPLGAEPSASGSAGHVTYVFRRRPGPLHRQLRLSLWFLSNLHRYDAVHFHGYVGGSLLIFLMARIAGRRVQWPAAMADRALPGWGFRRAAMFGLRDANSRPDPSLGAISSEVAGRVTPQPQPLRDGAISVPSAAATSSVAGPGWRATNLGVTADVLAGPALALGGGAGADPVLADEIPDASASITDTRFHAPFEGPADRIPRVITMVDAEEAFDWSMAFDRNSNDVTSMAAQHLAHRVFERHGVTPVYLVDYPVATQDGGRAPLRELLSGGHCDIGAQMHPWVTPPFEEEINIHNSYAGNLPVRLEFEKARRLTDTLAENFGRVPRLYRTGRFGAGRRTADILKRLGYTADSSVTPCWPAAGIAGSWTFSAAPYWADKDRTLLEIPVAAALVGSLAETQLGRLAPLLFDSWASRYRLPGALSRLGLLERIRLSPEGMTVEEAKRLVRHMLSAGQKIFVLTYHSPSLVPGNTPYVRDTNQLAQFLGWLDEFYTFFREEVGGRPANWQEIRHPSAPRSHPGT